MIPSPRRSFAARLLVAFMGTVGLLLLATLLVVRSETERQLEEVTETAVLRAEAAFHRAEAQRMGFLVNAAGPVILGSRATALVEETIAGGSFDELIELIDLFVYQLELNRISSEDVLFAIADPDGRPVLTLLEGARHEEGDTASLAPLFRAMESEGRSDVQTYQMVSGRLWALQARWIHQGPRVVGGVVLGFPIEDAEAMETSQIAGVEVCFIADGECLAGTPLGRRVLAEEFVRVGSEDGARTVVANGERWRIEVAPLDPDRETPVSRAIAVPMESVLAPMDRISRTLLVSGLVALLVALLASIRLARGLARPVQALLQATGRVAKGDYGAEVRVDREDEIGSLGQAFNEMTRGLRLKERYRGVLNKVVSRDVADELMRGDLVLGGEIRRVTILFADLRGFTLLTEGMAPQKVIGLLNECMEILTAAVDAESGVVDKYVGDEIMAVWGAPVRQPEDALRAVRAAHRMQSGMDELNYHRERRGEEPIRIGVGVNTGEVIAGNMGSADRLNYTVIGEPVNLASRLCSTAGPGEILLGPATAAAIEDRVELDEVREMELKGFSRAVPVRALPRGARLPDPPSDGDERRSARSAGSVGVAGSALVALLLAASGVAAQAAGGLPTLEGAGWSSGDGRFELLLSGRFEVEAFVPGDDPPWLISATEPFVAPRLRLFLDAFAGERWYGLVELRADRGEQPAPGDLQARVEQAFLRWSPSAELGIQAGRFASPFGGYAARHLSPADPFIRPPLTYDHPTVVNPDFLPGAVGGFLDWQDDPARFRAMGVPAVWGVPYQWGVMVMSALGPFDARAAWVNSAPSSVPEAWSWDSDRLDRGSVVLGVGAALSPALRLDASWSLGPYLQEELREGSQPFPGPSDPGYDGRGGPGAYDQELWGLEAVWKRGPAVVRGELFRDRWEVPRVGSDVVEWSWYVEAQRDLLPGLYGAARVAGMDFGALTDGSGRSRDWDRDVMRFEVGAGYRVVRNLEVRAQVGLTRSEGPADPDDDLLALQAWWSF